MNSLQCTFILALYCQICMADDTAINHRVEHLERQVIHLVTIFNQRIVALQSEVDNLKTCLAGNFFVSN
jgi:hypothetical protein